MNTIKLNIISPGKATVTEEVVSLNTETTDGKVEMMANHAPIILSTIPTISVYKKDNGSVVSLFTSTGVLYVKNNEINFCCDAFDYPDEIDVHRAEEAKKRAEKRIASKDNVDLERANKALQRSLVRLKLKNL